MIKDEKQHFIYLFNVYLYSDKYLAYTDATHHNIYSLN